MFPRLRPRVWLESSRSQTAQADFCGPGFLTSSAVAGFFSEPRNRKLIERLEKLGLTLRETATATGPRPLADQTFVVTGTLPTLSRQQARDLIESAGGHVSDSLSKKR